MPTVVLLLKSQPTLASRVDANSRAIVEIAANAKKNARAAIFIGVATSLFSLCAIMMVLASSRQGASIAERTSAQPPRSKHALVRTPPPAVLATIGQASVIQPQNAQNKQPSVPKQDTAQASPPKHVVVRPLPVAVPPAATRRVSVLPPENALEKQPSNAKSASARASRPKQPRLPRSPSAAPPAETWQASETPPESGQKTPLSDGPPSASPELKTEGQSVGEVLSLIADKLGGEGAINFTAQFHDIATGREATEELSYKASNVTIDPNRCLVGYHWHIEQDGRAVSDQFRILQLRPSKSISVRSINDETGGRFSVRAAPEVYLVQLRGRNNSSQETLYFHDRNTAARVGAATRQAMELCENAQQ
jgi:hypothetical protein